VSRPVQPIELCIPRGGVGNIDVVYGNVSPREALEHDPLGLVDPQ
jgi:hypothetical protein